MEIKSTCDRDYISFAIYKLKYYKEVIYTIDAQRYFKELKF